MDSYKIFSTIIFLLVSISIFATNLYDKVTTNYKSIKSFKSSFSQVNYNFENDLEIISSGTIYYDSYNFALDYLLPYEQKIVIKNKLIYIYDAQSEQLITESINDELDMLRPDLLLEKFWNLAEKREISNNRIYLELLNNEENFIKNIEITINHKNLISQIKYYDFEQNYVTYNFEKIETNIKLNLEIFLVEEK